MTILDADSKLAKRIENGQAPRFRIFTPHEQPNLGCVECDVPPDKCRGVDGKEGIQKCLRINLTTDIEPTENSDITPRP